MADKQRLDKVLANNGFGSRKEIKQYVKNGLVAVNDQIVKDSGMHVVPEKDEITVNGQKLDYREFIYLMMNKPDGVVSATWDHKFKTVVDLLPEEYRHFEVFPVGRLDRDTEGLLLLTNDGQLAHNLLSPKKHVPKTYYADIEGVVTESDLLAFKEGVTLDDGYKTMPASMVIIKSDAVSQIRLTIMEGKFHQVKRMFEAVGKKVKYLKRISMGSLKLDESLGIGDCRELSDEEIKALQGT